jgi:hypothetical protein
MEDQVPKITGLSKDCGACRFAIEVSDRPVPGQLGQQTTLQTPQRENDTRTNKTLGRHWISVGTTKRTTPTLLPTILLDFCIMPEFGL